jgi:DNA-binding NarL/FixJ family response regulator
VSGVFYAYVQDRSLREQAVDAIRSGVEETTFSAAWAEGGPMSVSEAVEYALSGEKPAPPASPTVPRLPPIVTRPVALTRREQEVATLIARSHQPSDGL